MPFFLVIEEIWSPMDSGVCQMTTEFFQSPFDTPPPSNGNWHFLVAREGNGGWFFFQKWYYMCPPLLAIKNLLLPLIVMIEIHQSSQNGDVATLALGSWPRRGLVRVQAKTKLGSRISWSWECKRVWGKEPSHSQVNSHVGSWSPGGLPNFQRAITRVKTQWIE
jgi:hypothetical protein